MNILISLSAAIAPAIFLVIYFYKQDKARPEPKNLIIKVFFFGILSTLAAIVLEMLVTLGEKLVDFHPLLIAAFRAFIVAALCEEWLKLVFVKLAVFKKEAFDEVVDGIIYMIIGSLGFACFENVMYVMGGGLSTAVMRAFTAIPLHAIASGLMGYYIGKSKFAETKEEANSLTFKGLLIAVLFHGYYDFVLFAMPELGFIPALTIIPLLIIGFIVLKKKINTAIAEDRAAGRV